MAPNLNDGSNWHKIFNSLDYNYCMCELKGRKLSGDKEPLSTSNRNLINENSGDSKASKDLESSESNFFTNYETSSTPQNNTIRVTAIVTKNGEQVNKYACSHPQCNRRFNNLKIANGTQFESIILDESFRNALN